MEVQGIIKLQFLVPVSFAILTVGLLGSAGQVYAPFSGVPFFFVWTGDGETDNWSDRFNWDVEVTPSCDDQTIIIPLEGATVHLDVDCVGSFLLRIFDGVIFIIDGGSTLTHQSDLNAGTIENFGTINNFGTIENFLSSFFNLGTLNNFGNIVNRADFINIPFRGGFPGIINNFCGSTFINELGAILFNAGTINGVNLITGVPVFDRGGTTTTISCGGGGGEHEPPTIGMNLAGDQLMVPAKGIGIDGQFWTVTENFNVDFELVEMFTSEHTISNTIYCSFGVDTCNHITLSAGPYQEDINAALWKVSVDKNFLGELTVTVDDPDDYLGVTTCTSQVQAEKFWFTSCTIDFKKPMPGMMLGVQVWDTYGGVRNFYFNDGIEIIDTYGYPYVDTEFEHSLDVPRLCLVDNPDKRTSCAFAEKVQLEIERAEKLLT